MKTLKHSLLYLSAAVALIAAAGCNGTVDSIDLFSEESYFLDANSTTLEIEFSTETPWEAAVAYFGYEEDWLSLDSRTGDAGSSVISVYVEPNYSGYSRKAAVTIADEDGATLSVSIEQSSEYGGGELEPDEPSVGRDGFVRSVRVNYNDEEEMMYSFGYNETGRLSDIEISFDGEGVSESYSIYWDSYPIQVRYGYDGSSIFIYDIESDGIAERIEAESEPGYVDYRAEIEYAGGRLHAIKAEYGDSSGFLWENGSMVESTYGYYTSDYAYSEYENNANIDLNWILSDGYNTDFAVFAGLVDMLGHRSATYVIPDLWGALEDGNRQLEPIPSDGEYTFTGIGTYFATEETETEFDFDGRLNEIRVSAPVYTVEKEYTVYRTITDYDKYDVLEDGTKVYYEYDEEIISERVVSRNLDRWESKTFTVSYY